MDSVLYPSLPNPTTADTTPAQPVKSPTTLAVSMPKRNVYTETLRAMKAELEAERAAQKVEAA